MGGVTADGARSWVTRSTVLGALALSFHACDLVDPTAVIPTTIVVQPGAVLLDAIGAELRLMPLVRDQAGGTINGIEIEWSVEDESVATISPTGTLRAISNGTTKVRARVDGAVGMGSVEVRQNPSAVDLLEGGDQRARAGTSLPGSIRMRVLDRLGTPVAGAGVRLRPSHGGSAHPDDTVTDGAGEVTVSWTLGPEPGTQHLAVDTGIRHTSFLLAAAENEDGRVPFRIDFRFLTEPAPPVREAFQAAARRWESILIGKLSPVLLQVPAGRCGANAPALDEVVDDLLILVTLESIAGGGEGIAAASNPCFLRQDGLHPLAGQLRLEVSDLDALLQAGILEPLIVHEISHVLGVGSLWGHFEFLNLPSLPDALGADTHFSGPRAIAAFGRVGGAGYAGLPVPVENSEGGEGTQDRHWRKSVFGTELLTGFLHVGEANPLSEVTIESLADLGYVVDRSRADPFALPSRHAATRGQWDGFEIVDRSRRSPLPVLDADGAVVGALLPRSWR